MTKKQITLDLDKYTDEGLYIEKQGIFIELTHKVIEYLNMNMIETIENKFKKLS